jgi:hypothetical protein
MSVAVDVGQLLVFDGEAAVGGLSAGFSVGGAVREEGKEHL